MTIETKELIISNELKRKVEMICKFSCVNDYTFTNGNIVNFKNTNIAYVKPHILKVKGNDYLIFDSFDYVFINVNIVKLTFTEKVIEDSLFIFLNDLTKSKTSMPIEIYKDIFEKLRELTKKEVELEKN